MSTLQSTPRHAHRLRTRLGTGLLALSALVAIGVAFVLLALTGANRTTTENSSITGAQPTSHAAPATVTSQPPAGYFRDPTTHTLRRIHAPRCDAAEVRVEKSCGVVP